MSISAVSEAVPVAGQIGRYFSIVSLLPATAFVIYARWLLSTGALFGGVDWSPAHAFDVGGVAATALVALVLALALNPLQFGLIQVMEGYWGTSTLAQALRVLRIHHHVHRLGWLESQPSSEGHHSRRADRRDPASLLVDLDRRSLADEARRLRTYYPDDVADVLPTRLGNVLRQYEYSIGRSYGLDLILAFPRLAMVAREPELAYVQNQRVQLELALRTCVLSVCAALITVVVLWRHGAFILLAAVPYLVAYLAYRGAVILAHEYGTAMAVLLELNRFALYERLGMPRPRSNLEEQEQNERLDAAFSGVPYVDLTYVEQIQAPSATEADLHPGRHGVEDVAD